MEKDEIDEEIRGPIPGEYGHPIPREILARELGFTDPVSKISRHYIGKRVVSQTLATKAVHTLCTKENVNRRKFKLPIGARTTFHMAFSPDGTMLASCHGDHNVYVTEIKTGNVLQTLCGHPRTPWCVVFHPTQNDILASGCLAGHVRVWDLNGGSEVLMTDSGTVIASLAFHPTVRLLAIATFNEIIFWDWNYPLPMARCSTGNTKEKVRLVRFDRLGKSLITGITNFPNCPNPPNPNVLEGLAASLASHRPNILSRRNNQRTNNNDNSNFGLGSRRPDSNLDNRDDSDGSDGPDPSPGGPNESQIALDVSALAAVAEEGEVADALSHRQDRFQESYHQLVNHYQDLVNHYQQFLRSRIPRLLETSRIVREQPVPAAAQSILDVAASLETDVIMEDAPDLPPPSDIIEPMIPGDNELPGSSRLMQLEARLLEAISSSGSLEPRHPDPTVTTTNSSSSPGVASSTPNTPTPPNRSTRNDTDLRSIEALAQNILEMQNLCSQARRDAPMTVETQHIIELQNIRRHLEVLQEQTRELQSSIRATLTSLARGSLDALRSHCTNNQSFNILSSSASSTAANGTPISSLNSNRSSSTSSSSGTSNQNSSGNSHNAVLRIIIGSRPPRWTSFDSDRDGYPREVPLPVPYRSQVPPEVTMQYDLSDLMNGSDDFGRSSGRSATTTPAAPSAAQSMVPTPFEPTPGTSRGGGSSSGRGTTSNAAGRNDRSTAGGPRRLVREYHVISGRGSSEVEIHARNCPFSGNRDHSPRPPPRFPCLSDLGIVLHLTVWPTIETGNLETRNFSEVSANRRITAPVFQDPRNFSDANGNNTNNNSPHNPSTLNNNQSSQVANWTNATFSNWFNGGPNWISNDVGVNVFLATRLRLSRDLSTTGGGDENWQIQFPCGLAVIPSTARQGLRLDARLRTSSRNLHGVPIGLSNSRNYHSTRNINHPFQQERVSVPTASSSTTVPSTSSPSSSSSSSSSTPQPASTEEEDGPGVARPTPLPSVLDGNLTRIFYMRAGEEIIPVYSHLVEQNEPTEPLEVRDGPLTHVFVFPIGLFLHGSNWENDTQTIGIYWPPRSRDEEISLMELRRSESIVPVFTTSTREMASTMQRSENPTGNRHRVDFNTTQTRVSLQRGYWLTIEQPGLLVLCAVSSLSNSPGPRPSDGTLYLNYISPFLEALERLFGYRQRNLYLSGSSIMPDPVSRSVPMMMPPWQVQGRGGCNFFSNRQQREDESSSLDSQASGDNSSSNSRTNYTGSRRLTVRDLVRPHNHSANSDLAERGASGSGGDADSERNFYYRSRAGSRTSELSNSESMDARHDSDLTNSARRVIRLAVDTATAEVLRGDDQARATANITRAIESRIERVLNERGNRGISQNSPSFLNSAVFVPLNVDNNLSPASYLDRQLRLEDLHMRISMLNQYSQLQSASAASSSPSSSSTTTTTSRPQPSMSVTSGTQTNVSFLHGSGSTGQAAASSGEQLLQQPQQQEVPSPPPPISPPPPPSSPPPTLLQSSRIHRRRPYPRSTVTMSSSSQRLASAAAAGHLNLDGTTADGRTSNNSTATEEGRPLSTDHQPNVSRPTLLGNSRSNRFRESIASAARNRAAAAAAAALAARNSNRADASEDWTAARQRARSRASMMYMANRYEPHACNRDSPSSAGAEERNGSARTRSNRPIFSFNNINIAAAARRQANILAECQGILTRTFNASENVRPPTAPSSVPQHPLYRVPPHHHYFHAPNNNNSNDDPGARFYPGYIPEILTTPRARPPTYYTMDAATTAFLSSRIQKWDFSDFVMPDITNRTSGLIVSSCSLHSDATLDVSSDSDFIAVLQPSDNGSYSAVGIYSLRDESLGASLYVYHFDQNTVSVSISPSCDYIVVGYAGRGPFYRIVHPSKNIGQILSLTRYGDQVKLVPVKELVTDNQTSLVSVNCMHWVPIPGYGIIYGTNTGEVILLS